MEKESSLLDIIIPVYNRLDSFNKLIGDLSSSILKNKLSNSVSLIVIDDASNVPIKINRQDIKVTLIRNKLNSGAPVSRKNGFEVSTAKFVHFHDSDDTISEDWLLELLSTLEKKPNLDIFLTARMDVDSNNNTYRYQAFYDKNHSNLSKIERRLVYRNCMGPLGGVTFSRSVLEKIDFKKFASCQDWQMYIEAIKHSKVLVSRPDIKFIFNKTGDDRISHNPRKKILGHLQLAKITSKQSVFKKNIRLFYLYTCKQHIFNKGGSILKFYKKNRLRIFFTFLVVSVYWRLT